MESVTLNTGATMPALGFGTSPSEVGLSAKSVVAAVKAGFRHIDCARCYGNEKEIGFGLKKLFEEGVVKREDLFITSKLWCNDQAPEDVPKALKSSLDDLQIDHLDLYLIHWPFCVKKGSVWTPENIKPTDMASTWSAMEKLYHCGKTHAIGVSNFSSKKLEELFPVALVPPAVNQVECHPGWQQRKLQSFCDDKGIHLSGYAPLGSHGSHWGNKTDILKNPIVTSVAEESGKTPAQVCLRWGLQMGHSVIVKSVTEARIIENFDIFNWFLPDHLVAMFSEIGQKRLLMGDFLLKPHEQLWDEESN